MSGKINVLPDNLTQQIAAGEVVERPASIVKELLENALDAGATEVRIELEKGGKESIRIVDDGEGMTAADVPLAFARYATSKIRQFDDIYRVRSFGFRGEALPSIASIARVEMVSRQREDVAGTRIVVEAGGVLELSEAGCPAGTSVAVSHIFQSVPVRRKFLKTDATEQGNCMDVITRTALAHPAVRIQVRANGREVLALPAGRDEGERVALVLGMDFIDQALPVQGAKGEASLRGFISKPEWSRSQAKQIYFYVNGRYIRDHLLNHAVMTAYRHAMEARRYPAAVLFIDLPPADVDVNVHPAKLEVRFRQPRDIYEMVVAALSAALADVARPFAGLDQRAAIPPEPQQGQEEYRRRVETALRRYVVSSQAKGLPFRSPERPGGTPHRVMEAPPPPPLPSHVSAAPAVAPAGPFSDLPLLGQVAGTYLVFSTPEGLVLLDQHAAHERILFERFRQASEHQRMASQVLLIPEVISLPPRGLAFLSESLEILQEAGLEVELFGGDAVVIKAMPAVLGHRDPRAIIMDIIEEEEGAGLPLAERREKLLIRLACHGAVKAGQSLSAAEVAALCRDLDAVPYPATCPHGRPTFITFSGRDLERLFRRR